VRELVAVAAQLNVDRGANSTIQVLYRLYRILALLWLAVPIQGSTRAASCRCRSGSIGGRRLSGLFGLGILAAQGEAPARG
jgi:hypothetical protein